MLDYKLHILKGSNHDKHTLHGQIFMDMLALRIAGYYRYYGNQLMPIDLYDHFCTHFVLTKRVGKEYCPIACLRSINSIDCFENDVRFLPIARTKTSNPRVASKINELLEDDYSSIDYDSGLTISPLITTSRENYSILKYMIGICLTYHLETNGMPFLISSIKKTKTDRLFEKVGFDSICEDSNYRLPGLESEEFNMMIFDREISEYSEWMNLPEELWESRMEICNNISSLEGETYLQVS